MSHFGASHKLEIVVTRSRHSLLEHKNTSPPVGISDKGRALGAGLAGHIRLGGAYQAAEPKSSDLFRRPP